MSENWTRRPGVAGITPSGEIARIFIDVRTRLPLRHLFRSGTDEFKQCGPYVAIMS